MPSHESIIAKRALEKERVDPSLTLEAEREGWDAYAANLPMASMVELEMKSLGGVECALLTPHKTNGNRTILYAHGGGLTAGSILTHRSFASYLAGALHSSVVLPEYRLLPENPPAAPSDDLVAVYGALLKLADTPDQRIFFGGDSSGAGLSITAMTRLRDQNLPQPMGCFSISGAFDATLSGASIREKQDRDPILSEEVLRHWQTHFGKDFNFADPLVSPLFASHANLAPTLFLVGEDEVWFDDTVRMYDRYTVAGAQAEMVVFEGMWHVWPMIAGLPETEQAFRRISDFLDFNCRDL